MSNDTRLKDRFVRCYDNCKTYAEYYAELYDDMRVFADANNAEFQAQEIDMAIKVEHKKGAFKLEVYRPSTKELHAVIHNAFYERSIRAVNSGKGFIATPPYSANFNPAGEMQLLKDQINRISGSSERYVQTPLQQSGCVRAHTI